MNKEVEYIPITDLLTDIIDNRGKSVPTVEMGFPLIATNCIKHSSIYPTFDKVRYVSENTLKTWFRAHIKPNDILFVNKGTPGRVCLVPNPVTFCAAQDMMAFRSAPEKINYKYLFAVLRSNEIQKKIENNHVGLVIPHFRKQELSSLLIPIKSKQEQNAIGELYILLSEKIELNYRINSELEAMEKTLYDYWFVQFDFPDKNGKPYKTSGGKMVWNEELKREIPEEWEVKKLKEFATTGSGGTPLSTKKEYYKNGDIPWINSGELNSLYIIQTDNYITKDGLDNSSAKLFPSNTLLIALYGATAGKVSLLKLEAATNQAVCAILLKDQSYLNYLKFALSDLYQYLINLSTGSARDNLSQDLVKDLIFVIPPNNSFKQFNEIVNPSIEKIVSNILENQKLTELRDWLLPMLMNGQVKVN